MRSLWLFLLACTLASPALSQTISPFVANTTIAGEAFTRHVAGQGDQAIHYYLAPSSSGPRPLLLVVQGSGCEPAFTRDRDGVSATAGQDIIQHLSNGRYAIMIVDKPEVISESGALQDGTTTACSNAFNRTHSLDAWTATLARALNDAKRQPGVLASGGVRLVGLSEGAIVAARLSARRHDISHVAFISGFGCGQWRDMLVNARRDNSNAAARIAATEAAFRDIASHPNSDRQFEGQTYLFWSTFGRACPARDLLASRARVFVAYGTADEEIDANGVEAITAAFLEAQRPIEVRRVLGGSHVLDTSGAAPFANLLSTFQDALNWMAD